MPRILNRARIAVRMCCVINAVLGLFGIVLTVIPDLSPRVISAVFGITAILFGITRIIGYFSNDLYGLAFEHDIILGSLQILFGIVLLLRMNRLWEALCLIAALVMMMDSMFKFRMALEARKFGLNRWLMILTASAVTCVLGLIGIIMPEWNSNAAFIVLGINTLSYAVMNLITVLTAVNTAKGTHSIDFEEANV